MLKIKAAVCREFGKPLSIETISIADPGPGEIRVQLEACAICHSDITYADGAWGGTLPAVYGHEAAGIVESAGTGVHELTIGDRVVVTLIRSCGHCHYCAQGLPVGCETTTALDDTSPLADENGAPLVHGLRTGGFAEYALVDQSQAVKIPFQIPMDVASLLACGVITGFGAVTNTARMPAGANTVVIGCGGVGLNTIQGAALTGAKTIIALDLEEGKLDAATHFGATHTVLANAQDAAAQIQTITQGRGADYVFVTVGAKRAFDGAYEMLAPAGKVVLVGMPPSGVTSEYDPSSIAASSQAILGSKMGSARINVDIPYLVDLYQQGKLKLDELISRRYKLEEINDAIASTKSGTALRNVIVFG